MKVIGERISIFKKENVLSVVILSTTEKMKLRLMFLWLMAWTVCGIIVFANYFRVADQNSKVFIIIYLAFWSYFEFNIIRTFMWKRTGKEKLWIKDGALHYQREINGKGKIQDFDLNVISSLELIELKPTRLSDTINQSFWIKGGERLQFQSQSKLVILGMQLTDEEAKKIMKEVNAFIL